MAPLLPSRTDLSVSAPPLNWRYADRSSANTFKRTSPVTPCAPVTTASVTGRSAASALGRAGLLGGLVVGALDGLFVRDALVGGVVLFIGRGLVLGIGTHRALLC